MQAQTWTLDGVGNWTENTHTTDGVTGTENRTSSNVNEIASVTGTPYANGIAGQFRWDNNGNLLDDGLRTYQWDALGRLHKVFRKSDGQQIAEYTYDAGNRRVRKEVLHGGLNGDVKNAITDFYYDGWRVLEEHDKKDNERQQYVYGNGLTEVWTLDKINPATTLEKLNDGKGQQRQFYYCDSLGSIYGQGDEAGSLLVGFQYDTFGRAMAFLPDADGVVHFGQNGVFNGQTVVHGNSFLYIGSRYDAETDLSCLDRRYYSAIQGRFISRDPIGFAGGVSLYAYVGNNPANLTDPNGTAIVKVPGIVIKHNDIKIWSVVGLKPGDAYGHHWFEIDGIESYGWWPLSPVGGLGDTFRGVPGELNGVSSFGGTPTKDPHHGDAADHIYDANLFYMGLFGTFGRKLKYGYAVGTDCSDLGPYSWFWGFADLYVSSEGKIKSCLRGAVADFKSKNTMWRYPKPPNCHSFQFDILSSCCINPPL